MALFGVLKGLTNTGLDSELEYVFSAPLSINSNQPAFANDSMTLKRQGIFTGIQRWELTVSVVPETIPAGYLVHSILHGYTERFYVRMPQLYTLCKIPQSTVVKSNFNYAAKEHQIEVNTNLFQKGEFIRFSGHSKVYLITNVVDDLIDIYPKLLKPIVLNEVIQKGSAVTMNGMYDTDVNLGLTFTDGILTNTENVRIIESL
jgi:hypothetical protein